MSVLERRLIPWASDIEAAGAAGGPTIPFTAGGALLIGDVVELTGAGGVVDKAAVAAEGAFFVGVVVGGGSDFGGGYSLNDSSVTGMALVGSGKIAQVQVAGIAYVVAQAAFAALSQLGFSPVTPGRVVANNTSQQIIGIALDAAGGDGDIVRMLIQPR